MSDRSAIIAEIIELSAIPAEQTAHMRKVLDITPQAALVQQLWRLKNPGFQIMMPGHGTRPSVSI